MRAAGFVLHFSGTFSLLSVFGFDSCCFFFYEKHVWNKKTLNTKMEIERELKKVSFAPVFFVDISHSSGNALKVCRGRDRWQKSYSTAGYFTV